MKRYISALLLLVALHGRGQVNAGLPDITEVVNTFFTRYKWTDPQGFFLQFEKRKNGWYIAEMNYHQPTVPVAPSRIFWNKATAAYEQLRYEPRDATDTAGAKADIDLFTRTVSLDEPTLYNYRRNLFFGYEGWDMDVMNALHNKPSLPDSLCETLARAYSNYAINYFYNQWGFPGIIDDSDRVPLKDNEPVSASRARKFMFYEDLAIATYQKLMQLNAGYQTMVGDVTAKKTNERMFAFTTLRFLGYEKEATGYLQDVSFPDSVIQQAKSMLQEVKPGGILITWGDIVTYSVWYLQSEGIRNDVIAIDYSLIGLRRVLHYLDKKYHHTLFETDSTVYMKQQFDYASFETAYSSDVKITLDTFLNRLYNSPKLKSMEKNNSKTFYTDDKSFKFFTKNVYLPVNVTMAQKLYGNKPFNKSIKIPVDKDYLLRNDMIVFSIIRRNFLKKRIYFSYPLYDTGPGMGIVKRNYTWEFTPENL